MFKHLPALLFAAAALLASPAGANINGSVDTTWGGAEAGRVRVSFNLGGENYDYVHATRALADGRLVTVGTASVSPATRQIAVSVRNADGTADTSIAPSGRYTLPVTGAVSSVDTAAAIAPDGSFFVVGRAPNLQQLRVWHYALNGSELSAPLDVGVANTRYFASAAYVDFAGRLLAGGYLAPSSATAESQYDGFLLRIAADGSGLDPLFGGVRTISFDGSQRDDVFAITGVGENYALCGRVGNLADASNLRFGIALVLRGGALQTSFNGTGTYVDQLALNGNPAESACNAITTVRMNDQTRIVIAGRASAPGQLSRTYLLAVGLDGQLIAGTPRFVDFGFPGSSVGGFPSLLSVPGENELYVASYGLFDASGKYSVAVARMDALANYDVAWGDTVKGTRVVMTAPAIGGAQRDLYNSALGYAMGRLYLAANIVLDGSDSDFALVRFTGDRIFAAGLD